MVLPVVGAAAGLATWLISEPFAPTAATHGTQVGTHFFTYGSVFGWVDTGVEGVLLGGAIALFLSLQRTGLARAVLAGFCGAALGGLLVCGTDNLLDLFFIHWLRSGRTFGVNLVEYVAYPLFDSLVLAVSIGIACHPTLSRLSRASAAGLLGGGAVFVVRRVMAPVVGLVEILHGGFSRTRYGIHFDPAHLGDSSAWFAYNPSRLFEHVILGLTLGLVLPFADRLLTRGTLKLNVGNNEFRVFSLFRGVTRIGSSEECEVPLYGMKGVAPVHATLTYDGREFWIHNQPGSTGIAVNGSKVDRSRLNRGDRITLGDVDVFFSASSAPVAPYQVAPSYPGSPAQILMTPAIPQVPTPLVQPFQVAPMPVTSLLGSPSSSSAVTVAIKRPRLVSGSGFEVFLALGPSMVGREPGMAICLARDGRVSRHHAELIVDETGTLLKDLGSTNGTTLNGTRLDAPAYLEDGDLIVFGSTELRFQTS
jgi:pSer/pThr/pTyr-binding forkhead associated (FHA) protein